jgi:FAD-dependent urate hydroxylase
MVNVVVLGAGPYGLSAAAHLLAIRGLDVLVFGKPMSFWEGNMPAGMLLRSPWAASHLSDPRGELTLESYVSACGNHLARPIPLERFIDYGKWFQHKAVPAVDGRRVLTVTREERGFLLHLEDGQRVAARRVIVAAGVEAFARVPAVFQGLPAQLASHASTHRDLGRFAGQQVVVLGAGQSALESAALLREHGARVELIVRAPDIRFLTRSKFLHQRMGTLLPRLLYAPADVGPAGVSRLVAAPDVYRRLPRRLHEKWRVRSTRPAGASWLVPRLGEVTITKGVEVERAREAGGRLELLLSDGSRRVADHALLGTGYRIDISRYDFLSPELVSSVERVNGFPRLNTDFESSVPGLHFIGAAAARTFGPLMQFVAGAQFAGQRLARRLRESAPAAVEV